MNIACFTDAPDWCIPHVADNLSDIPSPTSDLSHSYMTSHWVSHLADLDGSSPETLHTSDLALEWSGHRRRCICKHAGVSVAKQQDTKAFVEAVEDSAASANASIVKKPRRKRSKPKAEEDCTAAPATARRDKLMHICDFTSCRLPAEDWYVHSKAPKT